MPVSNRYPFSKRQAKIPTILGVKIVGIVILCVFVVDRFAVVLIENKALTRRFASEMERIDKGYADEADEKIRSLTYFDKFRYDDYPDDISAIFPTREGETAKIRVRPTQYLGDQEERHYFFARIIDGAVLGFGVREGELIILVVYAENGEDIACCFKVSNG